MKIITQSFLFLLLTSGTAFAGSNPFDVCDNSRTQTMMLLCQIEVVENLIEKDFGRKALQKARKASEAKCQDEGGIMRKLDPQLRRMVHADCLLDAKIEFYENFETRN